MKFSLVEFLRLKKNLKPNTPLSIISGSMDPWIKQGETVYMDPCTPLEIKPYDIIVFWNSKEEILMCHIFIKIKDRKLITKPLVESIEDDPTPVEFLLAKVRKPAFTWFHKLLLRLFH